MTEHFERRQSFAARGVRVAWVGVLLIGCGPTLALDYQFHGFASQGFVLSEGNNVFGDSTHGSLDYYEVGLSGTVALRPDLLFSVQGEIRDAGETDTSKPRLDYALVDYRYLGTAEAGAGLRLGRVKNPFGFYNDTRDVIFTRPGILMPASIYNDNQGQRRLLFAEDGAQLYGESVWGEHQVSLVATAALNRDLTESEQRLLFNFPGVPIDLRLDNLWTARLMDEIDGGRWRFAFSHLATTLLLTTDPGVGLAGNFKVDINVLSVSYNARDFSLTAEYSTLLSKSFLASGGFPILAGSNASDGGYLQGDYRLSPQWSVMARYDVFFADRSDRNGSECTDSSGAPIDRHRCFAHDGVVGLNWKYDQHWGFWAEHHLIDGTATLQPLDNKGRTPDNHWSLFMLMAAYRF